MATADYGRGGSTPRAWASWLYLRPKTGDMPLIFNGHTKVSPIHSWTFRTVPNDVSFISKSWPNCSITPLSLWRMWYWLRRVTD